LIVPGSNGFMMSSPDENESHGVREFITALFREIHFSCKNRKINFATQGGDESPQSKVRPERLT
jgi:hypothetical protein